MNNLGPNPQSIDVVVFSLYSGVKRFLGLGGPHCGHPDSCPPHACRLDDAVIHGYCCGCALPTGMSFKLH